MEYSIITCKWITIIGPMSAWKDLSEILTERNMQKSQNFCQKIKTDRKLILAIFLISISILNVLIRASWGFYNGEISKSELEIRNSETSENITAESFFENQENEQKLHFTTLPSKNQSRLGPHC